MHRYHYIIEREREGVVAKDMYPSNSNEPTGWDLFGIIVSIVN